MIIRSAAMTDLREMDALRRSEQEAVGFVPLSRWEREVELDQPGLLVGLEEGEIVAYVFWTRGLPVAAIQQCVVRSDARRQERGAAIVEEALRVLATDIRRYGVSCRVRIDLEATAFWESLGFVACRLEETGSRRGPAMRYYRELWPALLNLGLYLPIRLQALGSRRGFHFVSLEKVPA